MEVPVEAVELELEDDKEGESESDWDWDEPESDDSASRSLPDISSRLFRISWMNNWRSEMVGIKGNKFYEYNLI